MAGEVSITFRMGGQSQLTRRLKDMSAAAQDARPVWAVLRDRFVAAEGRTFAAEGGASGKWKPLSPTYGAWKAEHYGSKPILQRTGELFRSLTSDLAIDIRTPTTMIVGTDVPYGVFHQTGTRRMPARPFIDLSEYERRIWIKAIRDHLFASTVTGGVEEAA